MARSRGRPPLDPRDRKQVAVIVRMSERDYDVAWTRARSQRVTVPELLRRRAREEDDDDDD